MVDREITRLRSEILAAREGRGRARYPMELRERVVACLERRHAKGQSYTALAELLGMSRATLDLWKRAKGAMAAKPRLRRVVVSTEAEPAVRNYTIEGQRGLRVVGLSLSEVRELLGVGQ